jgi:hypothetical protein
MKKGHSQLEAISKTGFLVSLSAYLLFWLSDLIQPGFVSRYFSVHIFLLTALVSGLLWSHLVNEYTDRPLIQTITTLLIGIFLAVVAWLSSEGLGGYRFPVTLIAFFTPSMVYSLMKK